jgi:cytoskeletal protein CcmA (bactofilin family)
MAIWKDQTATKKDPAPASSASSTATMEPAKREVEVRSEVPATSQSTNGGSSPAYDLPRGRLPEREAKESLIASELTIEGKIEGAGHVRIAGRFKGDIHVQGNLTIENGAKVTGSVRANTVVVQGELEGNIEGATKVELLESGILNGDVKAGTFTVAAGSRMRGQVEFGWDKSGKDHGAGA